MNVPEGVATIAARNINHAFVLGIHAMRLYGVEKMSRAGPVMEIPVPVVTTYLSPTERVLFSPERDANPFFHLFESLWMLAGRNDVQFLTTLNKRMADYSDDGVTQHGAYGFRWREWFEFDQLQYVIDLLRKDPSTRRAVLAMWSASDDLMLVHGGKDVPCNTHVYFKVRDGKLMMTVCNRSNDMLWGAYGANGVHMSYLQEYVANKVGVGVGSYTQMSDSLHVYTSGAGGKTWAAVRDLPGPHIVTQTTRDCLYLNGLVKPFPLGAETPEWDRDLETFFDRFDNGKDPVEGGFRTEWWEYVAAPMWTTYRTRSPATVKLCRASDWQRAASDWLVRRAEAKAHK